MNPRNRSPFILQKAIFKFSNNGIQYSWLKKNLNNVCCTQAMYLFRYVNVTAFADISIITTLLLWVILAGWIPTWIHLTKLLKGALRCLLHHTAYMTRFFRVFAARTTAAAQQTRSISVVSASSVCLQRWAEKFHVTFVISGILQSHFTAFVTTPTSTMKAGLHLSIFDRKDPRFMDTNNIQYNV